MNSHKRKFSQKSLASEWFNDLANIKLGIANDKNILENIFDYCFKLREFASSGSIITIQAPPPFLSKARHLSEELIGRYKDIRRPFGAYVIPQQSEKESVPFLRNEIRLNFPAKFSDFFTMQQANKVSLDNPITTNKFTLQTNVSNFVGTNLDEFCFEAPVFSLILHIICEFFEFHPPKSPEDLEVIFSESAAVDLLHANNNLFLDKFEEIKSLVISQISQSGLIVLAGNGGSACDAEEFISNARSAGAFSVLPFADSGALTCVANDWSFKEVFVRQVEAAALSRDLEEAPRALLIAISTSGNSLNLLSAASKAREHGMLSIFLGGGAGGALLGASDYSLIVSAKSSNRIQESHSAIFSLIILSLKGSTIFIN